MKKVLIIETEGEISNRIEKILTYPEYKIFFTHDNKDGYKIAIRYLPDLILFCLNGCKDELNFIKKICSDEVFATIPLIIIAENFSFEGQREVMELGADDYIPEEFLESSLFNSINNRFSKLCLIKQAIQNSVNTFEEYNEVTKRNDHILVKIGNKLKLIEFSEIICITALKEYSKIITGDNSNIIVRKSLRKWIKTLPTESFLRIHRSTIININYIEEITKINERTYTVHLKNIKETFDFSYRFANLMRHTFPT